VVRTNLIQLLCPPVKAREDISGAAKENAHEEAEKEEE